MKCFTVNNYNVRPGIIAWSATRAKREAWFIAQPGYPISRPYNHNYGNCEYKDVCLNVMLCKNCVKYWAVGLPAPLNVDAGRRHDLSIVYVPERGAYENIKLHLANDVQVLDDKNNLLQVDEQLLRTCCAKLIGDL